MSLNDTFALHVATVSAYLDDALQATGFECLLLFSGKPLPVFNDDYYYPFRCNPQFRWLVAEGYSNSWLVYRPGARPLLLLYQPDDYWHAVPELPDTFWSDQFDIQTFADDAALTSMLPPASGCACLGDVDTARQELGTINPPALVARLNWQRAYKTAYEQTCLREANRIAVRGHLAAARSFQKRNSEVSLNMAYMKACAQGENRLPYGNIVALNKHAGVLHWTALSEEQFNPRQQLSLLIDAGADCNGYAADITRTYAAERGLYADLVAAIDSMQQELVDEITPGASFVDLHHTAHLKVAAILKDFGIVRVSAEQALEQGITHTFLPHGLGHHLGLQVHDVGGWQAGPEGGESPPPQHYPFLRNTRVMEEDQVLTIEPGLYFIESLLQKLHTGDLSKSVNWATVEKLLPYGGVRIEDNVIIHAQAIENLTRNAFATAATTEEF